MKNNEHIKKYITALLLTLFVSISTVFAQVNKTVGTRITDITTDKALTTTAILDLDSTTKGFFLPRMTTAQRDDLKTKMNTKDNGLAIYNIDIDCVEYWSERTNKWMSLCGSLPPATLDLLVGACDNIIYKNFTMSPNNAKMPLLQQGTALVPETMSMSIRMKVEQVGTYNIFVTSKSPDGSDNGYFFSAEGQFQSIGTYNVVLKANGTPTAGYEQPVGGTKGDKLVFTINGKESTVCTNVETAVIPADLKFRIKSAIYKADGDYNVNFPATLAKGNKVELDIDKVDAGGTAIVTAYNSVVGIKFRGTQDLVTGTPTKMILEPVVGESSPKENTVASYDLALNVNAKEANYAINGNKVELVVKGTEIEAKNAGANFGTLPYYEGTTIDNTYKIVLPIKVTSSGVSDLYLKGPGNIVFKADKVKLNMPSNAGDTQNVEFAGAGGILPTAGVVDLDLSGDATRFTILNKQPLKLTIVKKPVAYTLDCTTIKANRAAIPLNKPIDELYYLTAKVNVTQVGEYEIKTTNPVDNIIFSTTRNGVKKVFTSTGLQDVTLYAIDGSLEGKNKGQVVVGLQSTDMAAINCTDVKINVGYNDLKVLVITVGTDANARESRITEYFTGKNADGKDRFGINGDFVATGDVSVTEFKMVAGNTDAISAGWATRISNKEFNMIIVEGRFTVYAIRQNLADALFNYAQEKYGALVVMHQMETSNKGFTNIVVSDNSTYMSSNEVGPYRDTNNSGLKLVDKLNGGTKVLANNRINETCFPQVVSKTADITKPKKGYNYDDSKMISWYPLFQYPYYFRTTHDSGNGNFKAIVYNANSMTKGLVFENTVYPDVVWFPVLEHWQRSIFANYAFSAIGEPYKPMDNSSYNTTTGILTNNVMLYLIQRIADR